MLPWSGAQLGAYVSSAEEYGYEGLFATMADTRPGDRAWIYQSHPARGIVGAIEFATIASRSQTRRWVAWGQVRLLQHRRSTVSLVNEGAPWFRGPRGPVRLTPNHARALGDLVPEVPWPDRLAPNEASASLGNEERRLWVPAGEVPAWRSARDVAAAVIGRPTQRARLHLAAGARLPRLFDRVVTVRQGPVAAVFVLDADLDTLATLVTELDDRQARQGHIVAGRSLTRTVMSEARRVPGVATWACSRSGQSPRLEKVTGPRRRLAPR